MTVFKNLIVVCHGRYDANPKERLNLKGSRQMLQNGLKIKELDLRGKMMLLAPSDPRFK